MLLIYDSFLKYDVNEVAERVKSSPSCENKNVSVRNLV